jgi:hypothetical protein
MGALIPNPNDIEVLNKLNTRFGPKGMEKLRQFMADNEDDTFKASRNLHRVSYRLKIHPTSGSRPRARWFVFLKTLIGATNSNKIKSAIRDALNDWDSNAEPPTGCVGIKFWAIYDPGLVQDYRADIYKAPPDAAGQYWVTITLVCNHEMDVNETGIPDPTTPDDGEKGTPPSLIGLSGRPLRQSAQKSSPKKASKKTAKHSAKKAGKKAAKK